MRRLPVLVLALAVGLGTAGCQFSKVSPQATVVVTGRALDASGRPIADAQVRLFKEADLGEAVFGGLLALGTLGTICLLPGAPAPCPSAHTVTTDADGTYRFDLKGSQTQGLIGEADSLDVVIASAAAGRYGPSTVVRFTADSTSVTLPDARLWSAAPRVAQSASAIRLSYSPLPAVDGRSVSYSAQLYDANQDTLWSQTAAAGSASIDARVLEDVVGTAAVGAYATLPGGNQAGTVHASYLSGRLPVHPTAGAPPSRHRLCAAVSGISLNTTAQRSCAVTDGNLVAPARLVASNAQIVTGVVVDLGSRRRVHLIVARGLAGVFVVELSADGSTWTQVGTESGSAVDISPSGSPAARYIRLRSPTGLDESLMSQVSVW